MVIPEHLRSNLPDPLKHLTIAKKQPAIGVKSSSAAAAEADRLRGELAKLKEKREETALRLQGDAGQDEGHDGTSAASSSPIVWVEKETKVTLYKKTRLDSLHLLLLQKGKPLKVCNRFLNICHLLFEAFKLDNVRLLQILFHILFVAGHVHLLF